MEHAVQIEMLGIMVPIIFFIAISIVLCVYFYLRHRTSQSVQETVRTAIEQGQQLTPEILERLGQTPQRAKSENSDLRRGVILIAAGIGVAAIGALAGEDEGTVRLFLTLGFLPFMVGIAYLGLWRFDRSE
ncbi:MAG: DUF6249 domain-containing protein [Gammaproteobacteria bacterium]|nr:DUF6249 domain-containing protein [Gammaproteobacteria bacterium]